MSAADNRINGAEIGPLWAKHYPRIADYPRSKVIVSALVYIIEDKAKAGGAGGDWMVSVSQQLRRQGIPPDQFWEIHGAAAR
jgi:hypothetical protein